MIDIYDFINTEKKRNRNYNISMLYKQPIRLIISVVLDRIKHKIIGIFNKNHTFKRAFSFHNNDITIFDYKYMDGGGLSHWSEFVDVLADLRITKVDRLLEICAGSGYIGFNLFSLGFCKHLSLTDINQEAIRVLKETVNFNNLEDSTNVYLSDNFEGIPIGKKYNLIVGNPPHCLPRGDDLLDPDDPEYPIKYSSLNKNQKLKNLICCDPDWSFHKNFYGNVRKYINRDGLVILMENSHQSTPDIFKGFIHDGGGKIVTSITGKGNMYFLVSKWAKKRLE